MFRALVRGQRRRSGALDVSVAVLGPVTEPPRVAYAVGRSVGNAVVRNRVRRRLRAAIQAEAPSLRPGWGYLVRAGAPAAEATYRELATALSRALPAETDGATSR